jgi:RimJ/RimL family protein N-acetyltransferase
VKRIEVNVLLIQDYMMLAEPCVTLGIWDQRHLMPFCQMHADPDVMADLGGPMNAAQSHEKFTRYARAWSDHGIARWALEDAYGAFIGYCGVMFRPDVGHPLGAHYEVGWRLCRRLWGSGHVTKAATLALEHAWATISVPEILSYTAADNIRSQRVMSRLGLTRHPLRDFQANYDAFSTPWRGLVWGVQRP